MKFFILIVIAYFLTRLFNLTLIPIFTDEAIYLRWSQVMANNLNFLFLPLTDGKAPLFIWAVAGVMHFFPSLDPLVVGRLVSVSAGFLSLIGIYVSSWALFQNKTISRFSSIFYLFSPFAFFYDRFALVDGMLVMFGIWSLAFAVLAVKTEKIKFAIALGVAIGFGLLTKTQAVFYLSIFPLAWLFLKFKFKIWYLIAFVLCSAVAGLLYNSLRVFHEFYILGLKTSEFITFPTFINFSNNFQSLLSWQVAYLTIPVFLLVIFSLFRKSKEKLFLFAIFLIYYFIMAFINKVIYARFLLMFTPLLLIIAAAGFTDFKNKYLKLGVAIIVMLLPIYSIFILTTNPKVAPIAENDSNQYINSWSAGNGLKETVAFFEKLPKKKTVVGVEGTFGLLPFALEMYSKKYPYLEIKAFWPEPDLLPEGLDYYIIYQRETPDNFPLELIVKYRQGTSDDYFKLYKVK